MNPLRLVFTASAAAALAMAFVPAHAQGVIKIGEINSYKAQPAFLMRLRRKIGAQAIGLCEAVELRQAATKPLLGAP